MTRVPSPSDFFLRLCQRLSIEKSKVTRMPTNKMPWMSSDQKKLERESITNRMKSHAESPTQKAKRNRSIGCRRKNGRVSRRLRDDGSIFISAQLSHPTRTR